MRITLEKGQIRTFFTGILVGCRDCREDVNVKRYKQNVLCIALQCPVLPWLLGSILV